MTTPFYDASYGPAMEGILNYANVITDGWFANLFLIFIFTITTYTLSKSEWKLNSVLTFSFFLVFISAMIMRLFMQVNEIILYGSIFALAITVFAGYWNKSSR